MYWWCQSCQYAAKMQGNLMNELCEANSLKLNSSQQSSSFHQRKHNRRTLKWLVRKSKLRWLQSVLALWLIPWGMDTLWTPSMYPLWDQKAHSGNLQVPFQHRYFYWTSLTLCPSKGFSFKANITGQTTAEIWWFQFAYFSNSWFTRCLWGQSGSAVSLIEELGTDDLHAAISPKSHAWMHAP